MNTNVAILIGVIVVAVVIIAVLAFLYFRQRRSTALRSRFGPEYEHAVRQYGSRSSAEQALADRQRRVENIPIRTLAPVERDRFAERWRRIQAEFVDDPTASIRDADALVNETMRARGYPMGEFESRAEYLSVDHPAVIRNYRAAHAIAVRNEQGDATTEELRNGLVYYRDLFEDLLEVQGVRQ
jgi:hypothetical protein